MTKEEMIALSKKRVAEKEEKKDHTYTKKEYEEIKWGATEDKGAVVFRFLGGTPYAREKATDSKIVQIANVIADDGSYKQLVYPDIKEKDHFLWRFKNKVLQYDWDDTKPEGSKKVYRHNPELVNRILHNGKHDWKKGDKGAEPQASYFVNIIDYMDDWCKTNKHSKLASKGCWVDTKTGETRFNWGMTGGFFDRCLNDVIEPYGWFDEYQSVVLQDKSKGFDAYSVYNLVKDSARLTKYGLDKYVKSSFKDEEDYVLYDLDSLDFLKVSSYFKINMVWGLFIQEVDKKLGTEFYTELQDLLAIEKAEYEKNNPKEQSEKAEKLALKKEPEFTDEIGEEEHEETKVEEVKPRPTRQAKTESKTFNVNDYAELLPALESLTDDKKAMFIGYNKEKDEFIYKESEELFTCNCEFISPAFGVCPACGIEYN